MNNDHSVDMADFGYEKVEKEQKEPRVQEVFTKVAGEYDKMNDLMSLGFHRLWKDDLITTLAPPKTTRPFHVLDVAGGTGDIAERILQKSGKGCEVSLLDLSWAMLKQGHERLKNNPKCHFFRGNAEKLCFKNNCFDAYTVAFGLRNVTNLDAALSEAFRVLKPGGRFLCLEFSQTDMIGLDKLYEAYSFYAIPAMGKAVIGDGSPYQYLVESIRKFPSQDYFVSLIEDAGFKRVSYQSLMGGIVSLHSAWKI